MRERVVSDTPVAPLRARETVAIPTPALAVWIPNGVSHRDQSITYLMSPDILNTYNQDNLAYSTLIDSPPITDERIEGLQDAYDDGRFYQGAGTYLPEVIPLQNHLQEFVINKNVDSFSGNSTSTGRAWPSAESADVRDRAEENDMTTMERPSATARATASPPTARPPARRSERKIEPIFYWLLFPAMILFTLAITLPAVIGMSYSLTDFVGFGEFEFIGFGNYSALFSDPRILAAYGFTLGFSVVTVVLVNAIALALSIGLNSKIKFKTGLRAVFFIPMVISGIVIAYVFNYLFSKTLPTLLNTPANRSSSTRISPGSQS